LPNARADKGLYITTSRFTKDARDTAEKGSIPIQLLDGESLAEMFEQFNFGLTPVMTYTIDEKFFAEFK